MLIPALITAPQPTAAMGWLQIERPEDSDDSSRGELFSCRQTALHIQADTDFLSMHQLGLSLSLPLFSLHPVSHCTNYIPREELHLSFSIPPAPSSSSSPLYTFILSLRTMYKNETQPDNNKNTNIQREPELGHPEFVSKVLDNQ